MDKKIIEYTIITGNPKPEFLEKTKQSISDGWTPFGGVSFLQIDLPKTNDQKLIGFVFAQAFVKYEQ